MRKYLADALVRGARDLDRLHTEIPSIPENDIPQLLIHASPQSALARGGDNDTVGMLHGNENDQIKPLHLLPHTGKPDLDVELVRILMSDQVGEDVCRASVEDRLFSLPAMHWMERSELQFEVFEEGISAKSCPSSSSRE